MRLVIVVKFVNAKEMAAKARKVVDVARKVVVVVELAPLLKAEEFWKEGMGLVHGLMPQMCNSGHCHRRPFLNLRWLNSSMAILCGHYFHCQFQSQFCGGN